MKTLAALLQRTVVLDSRMKGTANLTGEQISGLSLHRHIAFGMLLRDNLKNMRLYHAEPDAMGGISKYVYCSPVKGVI